MVAATQGMPARPLPTAPPQVAQVAARAGNWLSGLLHNIFGGSSGGSGGSAPSAPSRHDLLSPRPNNW